MRFVRLMIVWLAAAAMIAPAATSFASETDVVKGKAVYRNEYGVETLLFKVPMYYNLKQEPERFSFDCAPTLVDRDFSYYLGGRLLKSIGITPGDRLEHVVVKTAKDVPGFAINYVPSSVTFPNDKTVIVSVTKPFDKTAKAEGGGAKNVDYDKEYPRVDVRGGGEGGQYELPPFATRYKYSDALVSLSLQGVDFRQVLFLLSEIGGVTIVLDPYWDQPPTGGVHNRPPGGPGGEGGGKGGGGQGGNTGGFRPGGTFMPIDITKPGSITMDLKDVPFDLALDMVIQSAGLKYIAIYPDHVEPGGA
jgi:hypothetical protein